MVNDEAKTANEFATSARFDVCVNCSIYSNCSRESSSRRRKNRKGSITVRRVRLRLNRAATPFFSKPFAGDFPIGNLFDHDKPLVFNDSNGYLLTLCGYTLAQPRSTETAGAYPA